jgi:polysaccharide biosynthesis/export protein
LSKILPILAAAALLVGCTNLPIGGPEHRAITTGATASLVVDRHHVIYDYVLVDLSENVLNALPKGISLGSFYGSFGAGYRSAPTITVGVGDILAVTIFESSAGGLFIPPEAGVRPGNFITLPSQTVGRTGSITVPYAGEISVSGRTPLQIKAEIERKLSSRAVEPQVLVTLIEQTANSISIVGDSGTSRIQVRPNERVLDILARAGTLRFPGYETFVTLQRKGRNSTIYFQTLVNEPRENIFIAPGDTLYVYREQQRFVAVGALGVGGQTTGVTGAFAFEQESLSLNEALAKAGGLADSRANASNVFLFRLEYRDVLLKMGVDIQKFPENQKFIPTVYRANYRDPSSYFSAQNFAMRHKDVIYVATADSVELEKFLSHTRAITGTVASTPGDLASARESFRALSR